MYEDLTDEEKREIEIRDMLHESGKNSSWPKNRAKKSDYNGNNPNNKPLPGFYKKEKKK